MKSQVLLQLSTLISITNFIEFDISIVWSTLSSFFIAIEFVMFAQSFLLLSIDSAPLLDAVHILLSEMFFWILDIKN